MKIPNGFFNNEVSLFCKDQYEYDTAIDIFIIGNINVSYAVRNNIVEHGKVLVYSEEAIKIGSASSVYDAENRYSPGFGKFLTFNDFFSVGFRDKRI